MTEQPLTKKTVDVLGRRMAYHERGEGAPILFLHGWPESWFGWRAVMALAALRHRVIAIDLPGVGGSSGDPTDGSKAALATIVRGVVEALELSHLTLVGQDVGGMVAYAYARSYDDLDSAVALALAAKDLSHNFLAGFFLFAVQVPCSVLARVWVSDGSGGVTCTGG